MRTADRAGGGLGRRIRRRAAVVAVAGLSAGTLAVASLPGGASAAPSSHAAKLQKITLTLALDPPKMIFMGFEIAQQEGFFQRNGLDVTIIPEQGGVQAARAVAAGDAYFEAGGTDAVAASVAQGGGLVSIWSYGQDDLSLLSDSNITSVSQLKGKTIGAGDSTGPAFELGAIALRNAGIKLNQVTFAILNGRPALVGAMVAGKIQAAAFHVDDGYTLMSKDKSVHVLEPLYKAAPLFWYGAVGIPVSYGKAHPTIVVDFLKSMIEAQTWMYSHPGPTIALSVKDTGETKPIVTESYNFLRANKLWTTGVGMTPAQIKWTLQQYKANGIIKTIPTVSQIFDPTYVDQALAQLKR
jgi:NitT/TauT family transport system substrate-binding protein